MENFKSGFISIIGRPNAGKSTLLNALVNQKVAIVTDKPQTTRESITAILTEDTHQLIFVDTPGIHKPKHELGTRMNQAAYAQFRGVDLIYYIVDADTEFGKGDQFVLDKLESVKTPVILILNKIDKISSQQLLEKIVEMKSVHDFAEVVPVSAKDRKNLDTLIDVSLTYMTDNLMYYPKDTVAAYPEQFIIAEIIREKIINLTEEEIPHSVAVAIERMVQKKNALIIHAVIFVNRESQKGMIIGKQGQMIKKIGTQARKELEVILGQTVFLENYVRVEKNWRNRNRLLNQLGYIDIEQE
ncbi:MAG TPA: GTPase Era [Erysipelothrix sp.]|nr:GTPase Era [Erysipelothrix sp.]